MDLQARCSRTQGAMDPTPSPPGRRREPKGTRLVPVAHPKSEASKAEMRPLVSIESWFEEQPFTYK